jgi:hypothetical protein
MHFNNILQRTSSGLFSSGFSQKYIYIYTFLFVPMRTTSQYHPPSCDNRNDPLRRVQVTLDPGVYLACSTNEYQKQKNVSGE